MNNITGNVLKSKLARVSTTALLAGAVVIAVGSSANAYDGWHRHWGHGWPHHEWRGPYYGGWYRPYYYHYAPPVVAYPPAYGYYGDYGPPGVSLNFNL